MKKRGQKRRGKERRKEKRGGEEKREERRGKKFSRIYDGKNEEWNKENCSEVKQRGENQQQ